MKPKRRRTTNGHEATFASPPVQDDDKDARGRLSRREAVGEVPREDDPAVTSSTHGVAPERRNEEPSDGPVPVVLEDAT